MSLFAQQTLTGLSSGAIYASLALALVLIYRSTGIVNFAQGEMAMFATYAAWQLAERGLPLLGALAISLGGSFVAGMLVERLIIRRVEASSELSIVIVTIGLLLLFNALAALIWSYTIKPFPSPFEGLDLGIEGISDHAIGTLLVCGVVVGILYLLLQKTPLGLKIRAAATEPEASRLIGVRVGLMLCLGWGLASTVGAVSGILVAPIVFLEPNMMAGVLIYAFASATFGGFDSLLGAIVGGLFVGVSETLAATYISAIGPDLKILVPLGIIMLVLLVRPHGLFGTPRTERV